MTSSSSRVHSPRLISGFRWLCQRSRHCRSGGGREGGRGAAGRRAKQRVHGCGVLRGPLSCASAPPLPAHSRQLLCICSPPGPYGLDWPQWEAPPACTPTPMPMPCSAQRAQRTCFPMRPGRYSAMAVQRLVPYCATSRTMASSSYGRGAGRGGEECGSKHHEPEGPGGFQGCSSCSAARVICMGGLACREGPALRWLGGSKKPSPSPPEPSPAQDGGAAGRGPSVGSQPASQPGSP